MAFLAPLFLAGLAALALPILLHLRKIQPTVTVPFSSLMFLDASPPITKRRTRLQDLVLLTLRCIALALLILAFARPFFPAKDESSGASGGSVMHYIMIDTSASMRGVPMAKALKSAEALIDDLPDSDWVAVAGFSDRLRPLISPNRARELGAGTRKGFSQSVLSEVKADWEATRLDAAVLAAVSATAEEGPVVLHIISDFQKGAMIERLRGEAWPDQLRVIAHPILPEKGWTNAGVGILPSVKQVQRARVTNSEGSTKSDFKLTWGGVGRQLDIFVPPGESVVFDAPSVLPPDGHVILSGDDFMFDNTAAWTTTARPSVTVWYPNQSEVTDTSEAAYFLSRAMQPTAEYKVEIAAEQPKEPPALSVTEGRLDKQTISRLRDVIHAGGVALFAIRDVESASAIAALVGIPAGEAAEAMVADHARLGEIDFKSAVFAPFADARYSDFSGIRFWRYRVLPSELVSKGIVLARFDSGDPAWLTYQIGNGTLHVFTTTWRPVDSQLALTTKFPALLHGLLGFSDKQSGVPLVGSPLALPDDIESLITPDGSTLNAPFTPAAPGLYQGSGNFKLAVQLDPNESDLTPLPETELRALGLPFDPPAANAESRAIAKSLSNVEQESRQRIGWWLVAAAAMFFLAETAWAALAGHRPIPAKQ